MAIHYPNCEWIFSPAYLTILSHLFNETVEDMEAILAESLGPCEYKDFHYLSDAFVTSLIAMYSTIIPIGFFGNLVVILVILTSDKLHTAINYLLLAVAVSDFILSCTVAWTFIGNISYDFKSGKGMCRAIPTIQGMAVAGSIYTLVFIAIERHQAILYPNARFFNSTKRVIGLLAVIWVCSLCLQIPLILVLDVVPWNYTTVVIEHQISYEVTGHACTETWSLHQAWAYSIFIVIFDYGLPLIVLSIVYGKIGYFIHDRRRQVDHMLSLEANSRARTRERKLLAMLLSLVVIFCLFWGPYFILQCFKKCLNGYCDPEVYSYLQLLGHASFAINPLLYAFLHERFREEFIAKMKKIRNCCTRSQTGHHRNNSSVITGDISSERPTAKTKETNFQHPSPKSEAENQDTTNFNVSITAPQHLQEEIIESPYLPRPKSTIRRRESVDLPNYIPGIVVNQ